MGVLKRTVGGAYGYIAGNANESLRVRPAYGVSSGPTMVPVHARRLPSSGKADMPGVEDIMRDMSSLCSLEVYYKSPESVETLGDRINIILVCFTAWSHFHRYRIWSL